MSENESQDLCKGEASLPLIIELSRNVILSGLQDQVTTRVDPKSLGFDLSGITWRDGEGRVEVTFSDECGVRQATIHITPVTTKNLSIRFEVQAEVGGYISGWTGYPSNIPSPDENEHLRDTFPHLFRASEGNDLARLELLKLANHIDLLQVVATQRRQGTPVS